MNIGESKEYYSNFFRSEDISKLIPSWEPWWTYFNDDKIEDLSNKDKFMEKCPIICDIKDFNELTVMFLFKSWIIWMIYYFLDKKTIRVCPI